MDLSYRLNELRDHWIFDWSYSYRNLIGEVFERTLSSLEMEPNDKRPLATIEREFSRHSTEVFAKGYNYKIKHSAYDQAIRISVSGLQRFLDLPFESYVAVARSSPYAARGLAARRVCSSMLIGILQGYGETRFGDQEGSQSLENNKRWWVHSLAFLMPGHVHQLLQVLGHSQFRDSMRDVVAPVLEAIDRVIRDAPQNQALLPTSGEYELRVNRLDLILELPSIQDHLRFLEIHCFLNPNEVREVDLRNSSERAVSVIAGSLTHQLQEWAENQSTLKGVLINTALSDPENTTGQAQGILTQVISRISGDKGWNAPLSYNYARHFPLNNPFLHATFRVIRHSVRNLLRSFERDTGIRLWCSIRRSGKTTAASFDLHPSGNTKVVNQTMQPTGQSPNDHIFAESFKEALHVGKPLSNDFFKEVIEKYSHGQIEPGKRTIFVLDEYELLFDQLRIADRKDESIRYDVALPLLNQLVEFSRENLLLMIGMQPDAHYILMEHNQFSPYVVLDHFPLFAHSLGAVDSEFAHLLHRVLRDLVQLDPTFINSLFAETGGHPYLTVNLLTDLFDWLITEGRRAAGLTLTGDDFHAFARCRLTPEAIHRSREYEFFRNFLQATLARTDRHSDRWIHTVVRSLQHIVREDPVTMLCPFDRFRQLVEQSPSPTDAAGLVRTASEANFLVMQGDQVRPCIPLLARIAYPIRPAIHP
ncbi:hypothetical protein [Paludisphaera borealis]|uniref:Uncharacterized protein n=1 Tax=Paludisphaera borealis TaxID=1387353 RepID=A0A1U7CJM2_9BACT|nr:hypothetical protein [Paludisphaera borealis]APW59106.1 hypothetical protein BSF38_00520 [Paludisphaera borealis]